MAEFKERTCKPFMNEIHYSFSWRHPMKDWNIVPDFVGMS